MSAELAGQALDEAGVGRVSSVDRFAAGNSSHAWLAVVDGRPWVVRTPIAGSGRRPSAHAEVLLGRLLPADLSVPRWNVVEVGGTTCTIAPRLAGRPIRSEPQWSEALIADVAEVLGACHSSILGTPSLDRPRRTSHCSGTTSGPTSAIGWRRDCQRVSPSRTQRPGCRLCSPATRRRSARPPIGERTTAEPGQ